MTDQVATDTPVTESTVGFSWKELAVTGSIMLGLVAVVSTLATRMGSLGEAARIASTVEGLVVPVQLYFEDTGTWPREFSGWEAATFHALSVDSGEPGWAGPYLPGPIRRGWNPFGGAVHLFDRVIEGYTGGDGFDVDHDGRADVSGRNGCMITFWEVPEDVAERIDHRIESRLGGSTAPGDWADSGRVEYRADQRCLSVLIAGPRP